MSAPAQPAAGPSKPRRKAVAENWDEDFDFDMTAASESSTAHRGGHMSSSRALSGRHDGAASVGMSSADVISLPGGQRQGSYQSSGAAERGARDPDETEMEDWDAEFGESAVEPKRDLKRETGAAGSEAVAGASSGTAGGMLGRRVSRGPAPLRLRPSTPPQTAATQSILVSAPPFMPSKHPSSASDRYSSSPDRHAPSAWTSIPPSSLPSYPQPHLAHKRPTNESTSSLSSAWSASDYSQTPSHAYTPTKVHGQLASPSPKPNRTLRHMKSGDMMPPPPLPSVRGVVGTSRVASAGTSQGVISSPMGDEQSGLGLSRRKSEKRKSVGKSVGIEEEHLASPGGVKSGKPGFWRRLSSQQTYEPDPEAEARRNRSSSVGSPTKKRFDDIPPLPPLPANIRSTSNASTASHRSQYSQHSGSSSVSVARSYTSTGLASILRRSSSNLANKVKGRGGSSEVPPTPSMQSARIPSGSSAMSSHSLHSVQSRTSRTSSQQSISRGYDLPSPSPQSPYGEIGQPGARPQMHQSQSFSATPLDRAKTPGSPAEDTQTTPKKRRPVSVIPPRSSGWKGEAWTSFPPRSPQKTVRSPRTGVFNRSPVKARPALGVSAGQPKTPTTPRAPGPAGADDGKGTSTFKRLQSLGKKHGRRLSGGWKFGTGSSTSSEERERDRGERRPVSRLETVEGSPSKSLRGGEEGGHNGDSTADHEQSQRPEAGASTPAQAAGGKITYSSPALNFSASPRLISDKFDQHVEYVHSESTQRLKVKDDKERRRQSWNDFVIPRNVLEKQKELKEGIRGVRKFASGIEALKTLQSTHAAVEARISSADVATRSTFNALEDEFDQWWEMATVLIEVGNTGQGMSGSAASIAPAPPSPSGSKRNRRITLASEEAKAASSMMRRTKTDFVPLSPSFISASSRIPEKPETRKASLPDPADMTFGIPASSSGGPPRASPDLWHGSTGRHELSKRQLEVLRTMLQTPVSEVGSSGGGATRPDVSRGLSGSSAVSSTVTGHSGTRQAQGRASRQSISRISREGLPHSASPLTATSAIRQKGPESFPSPGESTYVTPSDSMPSPMTASLLAGAHPGLEGRLTLDQQRQASKMRKGSKVGLAGLREFLKGLKGRDSRPELSARSQSASSGVRLQSEDRPSQQVGRRASRMSISRAKGLAMASPPGMPTPGGQWNRPTNGATPSAVSGTAQDVSLSRTTTGESEYGQGVARSDVISRSASRNDSGPPVSGKDRRRPGLRGIFRGGSGNWGDLVNTGASPRTPDDTTALSAQLEKTQISSVKRTSIQSGRPGVHPNPRQSSDPVRRDSRIVSDAPTHRSEPADMVLGAPSANQMPSEHGARATAAVDLRDEGEMTVRPRKSRVLGLGWPEDAPALRASQLHGQVQGRDRNISAVSGFSLDSDNDQDQPRHSSAPAGGHTGAFNDGDQAGGGRASADSGLAVHETGMIALTPENLPVLLEYLRQCEGQLREWRKRVEALDLGDRGD